MIGRMLLISLLLTLLLELPVAYIWGLRDKKGILVAVMVNILTNPAVVLLNFLLLRGTDLPRLAIQLPIEGIAVAVEAACYRACSDAGRPVKLALCANLWSYLAGLGLNLIF